MRLFLLLALATLASTLAAQQTVRFNVQPADAFVRIDGRVLDLRDTTTIELAAGTYQAEIWAPGYTLNKRTVTVEEEDQTVTYTLRNRSAAYRDHEDAVKDRQARVVKRAIVDVSFLAATAGATYLAITGRNERLDELEATIATNAADYRAAVSPAELGQIRRDYEAAVSEHEDVQASHNLITVAATAVAVTGAFFTVRRFFLGKRGEYPRPVFTPDDPFDVLDEPAGVRLDVGVRGNGVGVTLRF